MAGLARMRGAARAFGPVRRWSRARRRTGRITAGDADEAPEIRTDHDGHVDPGCADDRAYDDHAYDDHHRARGVDHRSDVDRRNDVHDNGDVHHNHGDDRHDRAAAPVAADNATAFTVDDSRDRHLDDARDDDNDGAAGTDNLIARRLTV